MDTYGLIICFILLYFALTGALHARFAVRASEKSRTLFCILQCVSSVALVAVGVMTALELRWLFALTAAVAASFIISVCGKKDEKNDADGAEGRADAKKAEHGTAVRIISAVAAAAVVLLPLCMLLVGAFVYPSQYGESYLGELPAKVRRLDSAGEGKVVVIGGSSVAFGLDSELLSEQLSRSVVNFGLYATLGTEVMTELCARSIGTDDIIVIAPETDRQTMSDYFGAEAVLEAFDGEVGMLGRLPARYFSKLAGAFYPYAAGKLAHGVGFSHPASGIYGAASFNEYGDIAVPRPHNTMLAGVDGTRSITLSADIATSDFIDYLNSFAEYAEKKGARVYFSFPPMNRAAVVPSEGADGSTDAEKIASDAAAYYEFFAEKLNFPVITDPAACLMGSGYFYDTNFHLNDSGVTVNTARLAADILRAEGSTKAVTVELPPEPALPEQPDRQDDEADDADTDMFVYEDYGPGLAVVGVTDAARGRTSLTLPRTHDGKTVIAVRGGALSGCTALTELTVNDNIAQISDGAFSGCPALTRVVIRFENADLVTVGEGLFEGAPAGLMLYVSESAYPSFVGNYTWYEYSSRIKTEK